MYVFQVTSRTIPMSSCAQRRKLWLKVKVLHYPLPQINDILDTLGKAKYFTSLNLASGYCQVEFVPDARQKSAKFDSIGLVQICQDDLQPLQHLCHISESDAGGIGWLFTWMTF